MTACETPARLPPQPTLRRLLSYVPAHRKHALLTVCFGALGFALSFAYPWIIGSIIDGVIAPIHPSSMAARQAELLRLSELAAITAALHALVVYGRGHFNVHLGDGIVSDLRERLFSHLQSLSMGFYARQRTGSILAR